VTYYTVHLTYNNVKKKLTNGQHTTLDLDLSVYPSSQLSHKSLSGHLNLQSVLTTNG